MSNNAENVKFTLKVMINEEKTKVLFAEAGSDFVDVLLSFLTLPLGTIIRVMNKHYQDKGPPVIGSLTNLHRCLGKLGNDNFWLEGGKQMLLNPRNSFEAECRKLKLNVDDTQPTHYFRCGDRDCSRERGPLISMYHKMVKCDCGNCLTKPMGFNITEPDVDDDDDDDGGVFTKKDLPFLISDDLKMAPNVPGSIIQTLVNLGITVTSGAELRTVTLGFNDIMVLLRASLLSVTPLTDMILHKSSSDHGLVGDLPHRVSGVSKKMIVKAWVKKSDRKLLFVQADGDFVDFLFSLLTIPLGGVEWLLGGNTSLKNIDNVYRSIAFLIDDKYLKEVDMKNKLLKPELPPGYLTKNQIFSLTEQTNPATYLYVSFTVLKDYNIEKGSWMHFKDPKGDQGSYVKQPGEFVIGNGLIVKRWVSIDSVLKEIQVCLADVNEVELHIGMGEALNILKASLTSKHGLSSALQNSISEKLREQEQKAN